MKDDAMDVQQAQQAREKEEALEDTRDWEEQRNDEDTARVVDHIAERALCRKFDVRLMPVLAIMCKSNRRLPDGLATHTFRLFQCHRQG